MCKILDKLTLKSKYVNDPKTLCNLFLSFTANEYSRMSKDYLFVSVLICLMIEGGYDMYQGVKYTMRTYKCSAIHNVLSWSRKQDEKRNAVLAFTFSWKTLSMI